MTLDELKILTNEYGDATVLDVMVEEERRAQREADNEMMMYAEYSANPYNRPPAKKDYPDERPATNKPKS